MLELPESVLTDIKKTIISEYPKEMCGVLIDDKFQQIENVSKEPERSFTLNPIEYYAVQDACTAIIHSHCATDIKTITFDIRTPSYTDYIGQKSTKIPWYIFGTNGKVVYDPIILPRVPSKQYIGRKFMWYINDCYTLVQDYYKFEYGIELINHEDSFNYMSNKRNIFDNYTERAGFISRNYIGSLKQGELLVVHHKGLNASHLGIWTGTDVLHQDILSKREPLENFEGIISKILTYKDFI